MGTAQASGIVIAAAARRGIPVALHTPTEVKAAVTGSGQADKAAVGKMVAKILRLDAPPTPADAADAARPGHHPRLARGRAAARGLGLLPRRIRRDPGPARLGGRRRRRRAGAPVPAGRR